MRSCLHERGYSRVILTRRAALAAGISLTVVATTAAHDLRYHVFAVQRSRPALGTLCSAVAEEADSVAAAAALDRALDAATDFESPTGTGKSGGAAWSAESRGLALDRAADSLRAHRMHRVLLNFGGEILGLGDWTVTVAHPQDRTPVFRVSVSDAAVSTSDPSERGEGATASFAGSVTVVAGTATQAVALATDLVVMGRDDARRWSKRHPDVGVLWVEPNGKGLKAWKWNLDQIESRPDVRVAWNR